MVRVISLPNLQEDKPHNLEKQGPIQKTPSNVKKMISTFESGSAEVCLHVALKQISICHCKWI